MAEFENVCFLQLDSATDIEAAQAFNILDREGEAEAADFLKDWHFPGEHETRHGDCGAGTADDVYETDDGYILSYNRGLGYIGLSFRIPDEN